MPDNESNKVTNKLLRLQAVIKHFRYRSDFEFANAIKYSQGYISDILNEKKSVPKTMGQKLEDFLGVDRRWFETGEGEMIRNSNRMSEPYIPYRRMDVNEPKINNSIPVFTDSVENAPDFEVDIPQFRDCVFGKVVNDNAMAPEIPAGAYTFLKPVKDKLKIVYGSVYYIEFDNYQVLRRLKKGDKEGQLVAIADNMEMDSDGTRRYQNFNIPIDSVDKIYLSKGIMRLN